MAVKIKTKGYYSPPEKEIIINAKREYLSRSNWSEDIYLFYVYCCIANRCEYVESEYNTKFHIRIGKLVKDLMLKEGTVTDAVNELADRGLIEVYEDADYPDTYYFSLIDG